MSLTILWHYGHQLLKSSSALDDVMALEWPKDKTERFSVYGFSICYPMVCWIEFKPKNLRGRGDVVFHFPDEEKLFVSWGDLSMVQKDFRTLQDQAEHSMQYLKKSPTVRNATRTTDSLSIDSHQALYNHIEFEELGPGLLNRPKVARSAYTVYLHCLDSNRYFAIYALLSPKAPEDFGDLFRAMVSSFKCH